MKNKLILSVLLILGSFGILKSQKTSEKFQKAEELIDNELYLEASQLLQELCNEDNTNYLFFKDLGYAYLNLFNFEDAVNNLSKAIELNPNCIKCYSHLARAWHELGNFETAESIIEKGFALSDTTAHLYMTRGLIYMQTERNDLALQDFGTAISLSPEDPDAYIMRANYYLINSEASGAYSDINAAIKLNPENHQYYYYRAYILNYLNVNDEALIDIDKAIKLNSNISDYYNLKYTIQVSLGNYDDAELAVLKSIDIKPDDYYAYIKLGDLYFETNSIDKFCDCYKKAIQIYPEETSEDKTNLINYHSRYCDRNRMPYYFIRTIGNFNNSNYGECINLCETGLNISGTSAVLYNVKGSAHITRLEYELAEADFLKCLENRNLLINEVKDYYSYPLNDADASRIAQSYIVKSHFGIAMAELILKDYDKALIDITKAIEMAETIEDFDDKELLYITKGLIYLAKNDLENAQNNFTIADEKNPDNILCKLNIAMLTILKSGSYNAKKIEFVYVPENQCPRLIIPAIKPSKILDNDELKEALDICDQAIAINPENSYAYLLKSKLAQLSGDADYCKYAGEAKEYGIFNAFDELKIDCK